MVEVRFVLWRQCPKSVIKSFLVFRIHGGHAIHPHKLLALTVWRPQAPLLLVVWTVEVVTHKGGNLSNGGATA